MEFGHTLGRTYMGEFRAWTHHSPPETLRSSHQPGILKCFPPGKVTHENFNHQNTITHSVEGFLPSYVYVCVCMFVHVGTHV